ncbi:MAG: 4-hydroxy-tetrahydrodipicolinate reductase [Gemmatimonadetes bacterium]|nr:4-hydroxy-tetrahydrodipicolinate reductase [Gemmatimonadota bacterium]
MTAPRTRLAIIGDGKMGCAVAALASEQGFDVVALLGEAQVGASGLTRELLAGAEVAIEFTVPTAAAANVRACLAAGVPVVSGTTGWDAERATIEDEVRRSGGALLWAPNFSIGVHLFSRIAAETARIMAQANAGFDAHLVDTHHSAKLDAPSGTARWLAAAVGRVLGRELPVTSIRTGSVPGTHELVFDAPFEQITLTHTARDRKVFASGALTAARWVAGRRGVFTLDHVLGAAE